MSLKKPIKNKSALGVKIPERGVSSVSHAEFSQLMTALPISPKASLAVAVSGGADSMALLLLLSEWATHYRHDLYALTVDHGLRKESQTETQQVAAWCASMAVPHAVLSWHPPALRHGIQEQARNARYQLLTDWCVANGISCLFAAHHCDDQAETLFFRLARGSGLDGLACMQSAVALNDKVTLLRPLLPVPKIRLVQTLQAINHPWLEDPSNHNPDFTRVRIRSLLAQQPDATLLAQRAYALTLRFQAIRALLEKNTEKHFSQCTTMLPPDGLRIQTNAFLNLPIDYGIRVLLRAVRYVGDASYQPRTANIEAFYTTLRQDLMASRSMQRTFAYCLIVVKKTSEYIEVMPEKRHDIIGLNNDNAV